MREDTSEFKTIGAIVGSVILFLLIVVLARPQPVEALSPCELGASSDRAWCCKCSPCEETESKGVASCTFEFCSTTPCTVGET